MKPSPIILLAALLLAFPATAEKRLKPTVCLSWDLYRNGSGQELQVCKDGDKPYLMGRSKLVTLESPTGPERVLVGYRGAQ